MITFVILTAFLQGVHSQCCAPGGTWSEWVGNLTTCYDYCGGAGNMTRTRTCLSDTVEGGCPCTGSTTDVVPCDNNPCYWPRNYTCLAGKSLAVACGIFKCLSPGENVTCTTTPAPAVECSCCPIGGMWGEWVTVGTCSDTCGACGKINRTRTCLTTGYGCRCVGNTWELQPCNRAPCVGRTTECCTGFNNTAVNGTSLCTDTFPGITLNKSECCPSADGLWNNWSSWTSCTATCGLCGTRSRTRTCGSAGYGCPCTGNSTQTEACGGIACSTGSACCGSAINVLSYDGASICLSVQPNYIAGTWTSWQPITGKTCNDTCGAYGSVDSRRFCPVGSKCTGSFFGSAPCGFDVCGYPRQTCATGYLKTINTALNNFQCTKTVAS